MFELEKKFLASEVSVNDLLLPSSVPIHCCGEFVARWCSVAPSIERWITCAIGMIAHQLASVDQEPGVSTVRGTFSCCVLMDPSMDHRKWFA